MRQYSSVEIVLIGVACAAAGEIWAASFNAPAASCTTSGVQQRAPSEEVVDFLGAPASVWHRLGLEAELDRR